MARRPVTREFYENLLAAYRDTPRNHGVAARRAGCDYRMAKRGWEQGWSPRLPWARPIRVMIDEEQIAARDLQRRLEDEERKASQEERDRARQDSVAALAQEGQMIKGGRAVVLNSLAVVATILPSLKKMADNLNAQINGGALPTPVMTMRIMRDFSTVVGRLVMAAQQLVAVERDSKGEPSKVIGLEVTAGLTVEEAVREIKEASALYELARERGLVDDPALPAEPATAEGGPNGSATDEPGNVH